MCCWRYLNDLTGCSSVKERAKRCTCTSLTSVPVVSTRLLRERSSNEITSCAAARGSVKSILQRSRCEACGHEVVPSQRCSGSLMTHAVCHSTTCLGYTSSSVSKAHLPSFCRDFSRSHHVRFFLASSDYGSSPGAQPRETLYPWVQEYGARMHEMSRDRTTTDVVSGLEASKK